VSEPVQEISKEENSVDFFLIAVFGGGVLIAIIVILIIVMLVDKIRKKRKISEVVEFKPVDIEAYKK